MACGLRVQEAFAPMPPLCCVGIFIDAIASNRCVGGRVLKPKRRSIARRCGISEKSVRMYRVQVRLL
jgi:hypothetical protein